MRQRQLSIDRRTALQSLLTSTTVGLAGCTETDSGTATGSSPFTHVGVSGTTLIAEFESESAIDRLSVVQPDGESVADRAISPGTTRETIALGTDYPPGEYTVLAVSGETTVGERTVEIQPEIRITDLKLGRNYPDEMYEGAGNSTIRSEVMLTVENAGTGPDAITQLQFKGDIPQPTSAGYEQSGIHDTTSDFGGEAKSVVVAPGQSKILYSSSRPFTSASSTVTCRPNGEQGQFTAVINPRIDETVKHRYEVEYTGEALIDCSISISEVSD